jgi:hypothetical protein
MPNVSGDIHLVLIEIEDHYDASLEPVRRAPGSHVQTTPVAPIPISALVIDARATCRATLADWVKFVIRGRDLHTEHLTSFDVPGMVEMLTRHVDWLGGHDRGSKALEELTVSARALTKIAVPEGRDWMPLGPCPIVFEIQASEDGEAFTVTVPCLGTIRAYPGCDPYCDVCLTEGVVEWWERQMFGDTALSNLVTAPVLVLAIHREFGQVVKEATIRKWVSRGLIESKGTDESRSSLYDWTDVAYALARRGEGVL